MTTADATTDVQGSNRYVEANGIDLWVATYGSGTPLILLHGGLMSGEMFAPLLPALAEHHQVITVDLQGHGRTADVDRPIDVQLMADDIAALIDVLALDRPDVVGYSLGGGVALMTAVRHPDKVGRLVSASANIRRDAIYPEMLAQQGQVNAAGRRLHEADTDLRALRAGRAATGGLPSPAGQDRRVDVTRLRLHRGGARSARADHDRRGRR
jgi:pimeloyl-ACP methyl ester carboxylesterase